MLPQKQNTNWREKKISLSLNYKGKMCHMNAHIRDFRLHDVQSLSLAFAKDTEWLSKWMNDYSSKMTFYKS